LPAVFALEGGGDLRAALLKNRCTDDHQEPKGGEEGEGAECCSHRVRVLLGSA